ncbi:MAG: tail-specific protease [Planctomycetes bacterium]|nr:tail-specific protease [Planctomycetota bacterium]
MDILGFFSGRGSRAARAAVICFGAVLVSAGWTAIPAAAWDLADGPSQTDRRITNLVTRYLKTDHLSRHPLDDEISERSIKLFLKTLDPLKNYFLQADIDEFMQSRREIDDRLKEAGDVSIAYRIFHRFLTRVDERLKLIERLIPESPDFAVDEEFVTDPEKLEYPPTAAEAESRWSKRIKYDFLVLLRDKVEMEEARKRLSNRYRGYARRMHQVDGDELLEWFLTSVTSSFDPHTSYMSRRNYDNFLIQMRLQLDGIGAALQLVDGYTIVSKIIPGGPADKDGRLKAEDRVIAVGQGSSGEMVDVVDMKLNDVVDMIRGKAGTVVRLTFIQKATNETKSIELTRAHIELSDSEAKGEVFEGGRKADGSPVKVGVVDLPSFYMDMQGARENRKSFKSSTTDVKRILDDFRGKGVDVVVLDLRHNGGGSLNEAISLTGLFINQGPIVQVKDPDGRVTQYDDLETGMAWDGPLIVATSKFSASASEILAGAIQDYGRGLIVGDDSTHGKGTVQTMMDLSEKLFGDPRNRPNYGALKISVQQFYRPNGDSTQKRGVLADIKLPSITNHMDNISESDLDYALEFDRVSAARFAKMPLVNTEIIQDLQLRSDARRAESEDYRKLAKNIQKYLDIKSRKSVPLEMSKFMAQRGEVDVEKEDDKQIEQQANGRNSIRRDFVIDEFIQIASDYLEKLPTKKLAKK